MLIAARAIADQQNRSLGDVVSDLARRSLNRPASRKIRNGIKLLPERPGVVVTVEDVNALRDEAP